MFLFLLHQRSTERNGKEFCPIGQRCVVSWFVCRDGPQTLILIELYEMASNRELGWKLSCVQIVLRREILLQQLCNLKAFQAPSSLLNKKFMSSFTFSNQPIRSFFSLLLLSKRWLKNVSHFAVIAFSFIQICKFQLHFA